MGEKGIESIFPLSGLTDKGLADRVKQSVAAKSYSNEVLTDLREPLPYDLKSHVLNISIDNIIYKQQDILKMVIINKEVRIQQSSGIKAIIKRFLSKLFNWHISPLADEQTQINYNITKTILELVRYAKTLEEKIERLEKKIVQQRKENNV